MRAPGLLGLWALLMVGVARGDDAAMADRLERVLASFGSVRADFTQDVRRAESGRVEHAHGTLSIRKPGRFRWDYAEPAQLIVCNGDRLWLYDPDLEQATVKAVREALAQTPAMILSGEARVTEHYRVRAGGSADGVDTAVLTPNAVDGDFREVRIGLVGNELRRLEFVDRLNQRTTIVLTHVERNPVLKDSLFEFTPPAGVDVIGGR